MNSLATSYSVDAQVTSECLHDEHAAASGRYRGPLNRLRTAERTARQGLAPRPAVVHVQRADRHAGRRPDQHQRGCLAFLVGAGHRARHADRDAVHGVPLCAGTAAGPAADDPVPAPVRLPGRVAGLAVRLRPVRGLQRVQHHSRRRGDEHDRPRQHQAVDHHRDRRRLRDRAGRLRPHSQGRAVADLRDDPDLRHLHDHAVPDPLPGGHVRARDLQGQPVLRPVRRGGRLPDQLGDLRFGLLPLHAAQRRASARRSTGPTGARRSAAAG